MCAQAGLTIQEVYLPVEDYREFRYLVDLAFPSRLRFFHRTYLASVYRRELRHRLYRLMLSLVLVLRLDRLMLVSHFANSFIIVARKGSR